MIGPAGCRVAAALRAQKAAGGQFSGFRLAQDEVVPA